MLNDRLRWSIKTHPHHICGRQRSKPASLSPSVAGPVSGRRLRDITGLVKVGNHGVGLPQRGNYPRQAWLESGRLLKRREASFQAVKEPVARVEGKPQAWLAGSLLELRGPPVTRSKDVPGSPEWLCQTWTDLVIKIPGDPGSTRWRAWSSGVGSAEPSPDPGLTTCWGGRGCG